MPDTHQSGKYRVWEPLLLAVCVVIGLLAGARFNKPAAKKSILIESVRADHGRELNEIVRFIEEKYVDDVNSEKLISEAINSLVSDLDPHSGYLSPEEVQRSE